MFAIVDVETTGLSLDSDRVLEVAIIVYDGDQIAETVMLHEGLSRKSASLAARRARILHGPRWKELRFRSLTYLMR